MTKTSASADGARRAFKNESVRLATAERRERQEADRAAEIEASRAANAALLALEATYAPLPGENFEDEQNQRATAELLSALQREHGEVHDADVR